MYLMREKSFPIFYLTLTFLINLFATPTYSQDDCPNIEDIIFINEIHYTTAGFDPNDGLEIVGVAGTDLSNYRITVYTNLLNGLPGDPIIFDPLNEQTIIPDEGNGFGAIWKPIGDFFGAGALGIALFNVEEDRLVQFISVRGGITPNLGDAAGVAATVISTTAATPQGTSLQLTGGPGKCPFQFDWLEGVPESRGNINDGQIFQDKVNILSIVDQPLGCIKSDSLFEVTICAVDEISGEVDLNFNDQLFLNIDDGNVTNVFINDGATVNGCVTFIVRITLEEAVEEDFYSFSAQGGNLNVIPLEPISISQACSGIELMTAVTVPCGNDRQNELISAVNGETPIHIEDIVLSIVDPSAPIQPDVMSTWSFDGTAEEENAGDRECGIDMNCNRFALSSDLNDLPLIEELGNTLNDIAELNCPNNQITFQFLNETGIVPPFAKMIFFLGPAGNANEGGGFDNAIQNLDFSIYCGEEIYPIFAFTDNNINGDEGQLDDNNPQIIRVSVEGDITSVLAYNPTQNVPNLNPIAGESVTISKDGTYQISSDCVPNYLFEPSPLNIGTIESTHSEIPSFSNNMDVLKVFPNPVVNNGYMEIFIPMNDIVNIYVYDVHGKLSLQKNIILMKGNHTIELPTDHLSAGMYTYQVQYRSQNRSGLLQKN